jgi:hypothetical protein
LPSGPPYKQNIPTGKAARSSSISGTDTRDLIISKNSFIAILPFTDIDQNGYALFPVATINGYIIPQIGHHYKQSKKKNL